MRRTGRKKGQTGKRERDENESDGEDEEGRE